MDALRIEKYNKLFKSEKHGVKPYRKEDDDWVINEPIQTAQLMTKVF